MIPRAARRREGGRAAGARRRARRRAALPPAQRIRAMPPTPHPVGAPARGRGADRRPHGFTVTDGRAARGRDGAPRAARRAAPRGGIREDMGQRCAGGHAAARVGGWLGWVSWGGVGWGGVGWGGGWGVGRDHGARGARQMGAGRRRGAGAPVQGGQRVAGSNSVWAGVGLLPKAARRPSWASGGGRAVQHARGCAPRSRGGRQ
jgi:hypothetical protein